MILLGIILIALGVILLFSGAVVLISNQLVKKIDWDLTDLTSLEEESEIN